MSEVRVTGLCGVCYSFIIEGKPAAQQHEADCPTLTNIWIVDNDDIECALCQRELNPSDTYRMIPSLPEDTFDEDLDAMDVPGIDCQSTDTMPVCTPCCTLRLVSSAVQVQTGDLARTDPC